MTFDQNPLDYKNAIKRIRSLPLNQLRYMFDCNVSTKLVNKFDQLLKDIQNNDPFITLHKNYVPEMNYMKNKNMPNEEYFFSNDNDNTEIFCHTLHSTANIRCDKFKSVCKIFKKFAVPILSRLVIFSPFLGIF